MVMFKDNKYTKIYYNIIEKSKNKIYNDKTEKHHIIPKCLGGDNSKNNIAIVSCREHYILHKLLTKMVSGEDIKKMWWALHRMSTTYIKIHNSKLYEKFRKQWSQHLKENHHSKNIGGWSEKMSDVAKKSWHGDEKRKKEFSFIMKNTIKKIRNNNEDEYLKEMSRRAKRGGDISKEKNSLKLEYNGNIYRGWKDLEEIGGISKIIYKTYYLNGYDPKIRIGKKHPISYDEIMTYSSIMGANPKDILSDMLTKKMVTEKRVKIIEKLIIKGESVDGKNSNLD